MGKAYYTLVNTLKPESRHDSNYAVTGEIIGFECKWSAVVNIVNQVKLTFYVLIFQTEQTTCIYVLCHSSTLTRPR